MPGGAGMAGALGQLAGAGRTELLQAQQAASVFAQGMGMYGAMPGGGLVGFAEQYAGMAAPERRRLGMLMGGNRQLWSQIGREQGRPELITMEEGGLPIFTTEMRGIQDQVTEAQRGYRDWQIEQRQIQQQATEAYTFAGWGLQDRLDMPNLPDSAFALSGIIELLAASLPGGAEILRPLNQRAKDLTVGGCVERAVAAIVFHVMHHPSGMVHGSPPVLSLVITPKQKSAFARTDHEQNIT